MPRSFPLIGYPKNFIPTAPNHFTEKIIEEIVESVLFVELENPVSSYPALIAANSFVNEFEPETAVQLIDNFHKTKRKRRRVHYFKEVYCRNKILRDFIKLKPTCFLIMGVPCEKHYEIGEAFAEKLSHVHVNVLDLINDEMAKGTDAGKWIYTNLRMDRDIPVKLILQLLAKALRRPDVTYRGYVLTSFPIIPFKRFVERRLPVRFTHLDELNAPPVAQCKKWLSMDSKVIKCPGQDCDKFYEDNEGDFDSPGGVSDSGSSYKSDKKEFLHEEEAETTEAYTESTSESEGSEFDPEHDLCLHEIIDNPRLRNQLDEVDVVSCVREQFNALLTLDLPPDIVVYFRHDEDDNLPCSPTVSKLFKLNMEEAAAEAKSFTASDKVVFNEDYSDALPSPSLDTLGTNNSSRSSSTSEDYTDDFCESPDMGMDEQEVPLYMKRFISVKKEMEQFILHYSKDMVIKVDNRYSIKEVLEQLDIRTKFINYKSVKEAVPLFPDGIDKNLKQKLSTLKTTEEQLNWICRIDPVMPTLIWRKGSFMTKCPVKLYQGKIIEGQILFAVRFLGYIHLLSSFSVMKQFIRDPCKYFLCKPTCRVAIVGPRIPSVTSVMKSILGCADYDWKTNPDRQTCCRDIYREASDWANQVMENIDGQRFGSESMPKTRGLSRMLESFRTATERLLSLLSDELSTEEDVNPSEIFNDIGLDSENPDLIAMLRSVFNDKERATQMPQILRASLKAVHELPLEEIFDTLVEEKFNEIFKQRYSDKLSREICEWIKQQDREVSIRTNRSQKYAKWLIHDAPTDVKFWKYLERHNALPDVVIFLKQQTPFRLLDLYSKQKGQLKDVHHIASYIIGNFPLLFHEAECMLKKLQSDRFTDPKPFSPLEEMLNGIEVDIGVKDSSSYEDLENYLNRKRVITIVQDLQENDSTTSNVAVVQKYFEIFKTKPMVPLEIDIEYLRSINAEFEKVRVVVGKAHKEDFSECFDLSLKEVHRPLADSEESNEEAKAAEKDFAETSERNRKNIKMRADFQHLQYGNTKRYCPVTYLEHNSLLYGLPEYSVEYGNRLYMMSSPETQQEFLKRPFKYAHDCLELTPPPFRCCVAGPHVMNRHLFASLLAIQRKVMMSSFTCLLKEYIEKRNLMSEWVRTSYEEVYENYCDDFLSTHVSRYFKEGFVLEGFPTTSKEFEDMLRHHIYPEFIVIVDGRQSDIVQNLFNREKHVWEDKLIWLTNVHRLQTEGDGAMEEFEVEDILGFEVDTYLETEDDVESNRQSDDNIIPSEEERERIFAELLVRARKSVNKHIEGIKSVARLATENNIPVVQEPFIPSRKKGNLMKYALESISPGTSRRTMFEHVFTIPLEMAENLLATGMCFYSHFKNFDPVDAYNLIPVNRHESMRKTDRLYACIYRRLIYYLNGEENLVEFCNNPKLFVKGDFPFSLAMPMRMAILGSPYSGTTTLCNRIAKEFNMKVFTKDDLISTIKTKFPCSNLARQAPDSIPSNKLFIESMHVARNCSSNGFILDNYQMDPNDIVNIAKHDAALHLVLLVDSDFKTVWRNWKAEHTRRKIVAYMNILVEVNKHHKMFKKYKKMLRVFAGDVRDIRLFNIVVVNKTKSKWEQWDEARSQIYISLREIGGYFNDLDNRECFSLSHINVFWSEFEKRLSPIKLFCPVCLRFNRKLTQFRYDYVPVGLNFYDRKCQQQFNEPFGYNLDSLYEQFQFPSWYKWQTEKKPLVTNNAFRENLIQFRDHFYWSCDRHRFDLLLHTGEYLPPDCNFLPLYVPFLVTNYFNVHVQHEGRCVVSCYATKSLVKGSDQYAVFYRGKVFLLASPLCAVTFLQQPEVFYNFSGFEEHEPFIDWDIRDMTIDYGSLTPELLVEALIALTKERPKHHGLSIADSASIFVGLFLKCANPNNSLDVTKLYQEVISNYLFDCGRFRIQLEKLQSQGNPHITRLPTEMSTRKV